nr:heme-binding protein [Sphingomonas bacterium]
MGLTLEQAARVVDAALEHADALRLNPLTVAVLDAGGHLLAFKRQDGAGILRPEIAIGKAWGTLGMGLGGRALAKRSEMAPAFYTALVGASGGRVIPVPGGVLIRGSAGDIVGAVGISGDMPDKDEACAVFGIEQAGLSPDIGSDPLSGAA